MQISGEPFASGFAGRNLGDYDRNYIPPNQYILNIGSDDPIPIMDLFGFGTAVESYEYSKYYMNMEIQETTAGVSLADGPIVATLPGATSLDRLRARMQDLLDTRALTLGGYATLPAPVDNTSNYLGFPGQWPIFLPFKDWDPTLDPSLAVVQSCTYQGGYGGLGFSRHDDRSALRMRLQLARTCPTATSRSTRSSCPRSSASPRGRRPSGRSTSPAASTTRATTQVNIDRSWPTSPTSGRTATW